MLWRKLSVFAVAAMVAPLSAMEWATDYEEAAAQAARENKALILDFTGSDWCGSCIQLRQRVLDTPRFEACCKDKFVCVEVDMPRNKVQTPELIRQNKQLCERYGIRFFPTILILSPEGDVLGGFIGGVYSTETIHKPLDLALSNLEKLRTARATQGVERARLLGEISRSLPQELKNLAQTYKPEIAEHDPDDTCGFLKLTEEEQREAFLRDIHAAGGDYKRVLSLVEARLPMVSGKEKGEVLRIKGMALAYSAETEAELETAKATLLEAAEHMGPGRAQDSLRAYVAKEFQDIPALLQKLNERRDEEKKAQSGDSEMESLTDKLHACGSDFKRALELIDGQLALGKQEQRAELLQLKASVLMNTAESVEDLEVVKAMFLEAARLRGDTPEARYLKRFVDKEFSDSSALLERLRKNR